MFSIIPKYLSDFHDNRSMKTLNTTLTVSLFTTLLLTGCMPDSLTKFKKDPPKKAEVVAENPPSIVDSTGNTIDVATLTDPTTFQYSDEVNSALVTTINAKLGEKVELSAEFDGSVGETSKVASVMKGCSISPALPSGLVLDTSKSATGCSITGFPLVISTDAFSPGSPVTYTVTMSYLSNAGTTKTIATTIGIGVYTTPGQFDYLQNEKILLKVAPQSGSISSLTTNSDVDATYTRSGFLTSGSGITGVIKYIDSDNFKIGLIKVIPIRVNNFALLGLPSDEYPGLLSPRFISAAGGKSAKVIRAVAATSTLYVEMISSKYFTAGDVLDDTKSFLASTGATVASVDLTTGFKKGTASTLEIDNNIQYFVNLMTGSQVSRVYEVAKTFGTDLPRLTMTSPAATGVMTPSNGVKFTVSPELPNGLSINEDTGEITGSFVDILDPAVFTIKATNPLGSSTADIGLSSIKAPLDLSYTNRQLVAVKSTVKFLESENLIQGIIAPSTTSITGQILRKYDRGSGSDENRYKMAIDASNGYFVAGGSLDSGNSFSSEKSFIPSTAITPTASTLSTVPVNVNYNLAITVGTVAPFAIGGYVSTPQGALGKVVAIEGTTLFIQQLTPGSTPVFTAFQERNGGAANSIDNVATYVAPETTISQIEAGVTTITMSAIAGTPDFTVGQDITSSGKLGAYIFDSNQTSAAAPVDPTIISVSNVTKNPNTSPFLRNGQTVYDNENETGANTGTITNVANQNIYFAETGKYMEYRANLTEGNSLTYTVSPALPSGLTLNKATGLISGTPSIRTTLKSYAITATNLIGKSSYLIQIEVRDYFKLTDSSGAATFTLHKYGKNMQSRGCKINATDILEGNGLLDVRCFLDAEEEELHNTAIKFASAAGAGICEFIQVEPYNFKYYSPLQTTPNTKYTTSGCAAQSDLTAPQQALWLSYTPTAETDCDGNYEPDDGPNCDAGEFTIINVTGSASTSGGACDTFVTDAPRVVKCGGKPSSCIHGPIRDILSADEIEKGFRSLIYPTSTGKSIPVNLRSPASQLHYTNLYVANSSVNNNCSMTNADADTWESRAFSTTAITAPYGKSQPFYTFNCLDGAKDIKARIRLSVRDWNKAFKINSSIDFDLPGVAPLAADLMNNTATVFGKSNNDYYDWDDAYNGVASGFAGTCGVIGAGTQYLYPEGEL